MKTVVIIGLVLFLFFVGIGVGVWLYFFPPGVYVRDRFSTENSEIASQLKENGSKVHDGVVDFNPDNEKFYSLIYQTPASPQTTLEATATWKEGDESTILGLICCATDKGNFTSFMINGKGIYSVYQYIDSKWYEMLDDCRVPKSVQIQKGTTSKMKVVVEGDYLTFYLNDVMAVKLADSFTEHKGKVGLYVQGGKAGNTTVSFDQFEAKKNSMFQKD